MQRFVRAELRRAVRSGRMLVVGAGDADLDAAGVVPLGIARPEQGAANIDSMHAQSVGRPIRGWVIEWNPVEQTSASKRGIDGVLDFARRSGARVVCFNNGPFMTGSSVAMPASFFEQVASEFAELQLVVFHGGLSSIDEAVINCRHSRGRPTLTGLAELCDVADRAPSLHLEIGSMFRLLARSSPAACAHAIAQAHEAFGPRRLLWGTCPEASSYQFVQDFGRFRVSRRFRAKFGYAAFGVADHEQILAKTAARLFGI